MSENNILVVGYGRAGKDTAAMLLRDLTDLRYGGSTSWAAKELVAEELGLHPMEAWQFRHSRRAEWKRICDRLRQFDQTLLIRKCLATGEIIAGVRDGAELDAAKKQGLFKAIVWIERPGTPVDPTVTFGPGDCTCSVLNDGTLEQLRARLDRLATELGLPRRVSPSPTNDIIRE